MRVGEEGRLCPSLAGYTPEGLQLTLALGEEGTEAGEHVASVRLLLEAVEGGQWRLAGGTRRLEHTIWEQELQEVVQPVCQVGAALLDVAQLTQQIGFRQLQLSLLLVNML